LVAEQWHSLFDVDVHRRKTVLKAFRDEALRRQVITFVKFVAADDAENAVSAN
jgi:hypothetical protein